MSEYRRGGKSVISPEVAGYGLKRVRCSGCP